MVIGQHEKFLSKDLVKDEVILLKKFYGLYEYLEKLGSVTHYDKEEKTSYTNS